MALSHLHTGTNCNVEAPSPSNLSPRLTHTAHTYLQPACLHYTHPPRALSSMLHACMSRWESRSSSSGGPGAVKELRPWEASVLETSRKRRACGKPKAGQEVRG